MDLKYRSREKRSRIITSNSVINCQSESMVFEVRTAYKISGEKNEKSEYGDEAFYQD